LDHGNYCCLNHLNSLSKKSKVLKPLVCLVYGIICFHAKGCVLLSVSK
jgi:hypothetical protein